MTDSAIEIFKRQMAKFKKENEKYSKDAKKMKGGSITDTYDVEYFNPAHKQAYNNIMNAYLTHRDKKQKKAGSDYYEDLEKREKVYKEKIKKKRGRPRKIKGRGIEDESDSSKSEGELEKGSEGIGSIDLQMKNQQLGDMVNKSISDYYSNLMSNTAMSGIRK